MIPVIIFYIHFVFLVYVFTKNFIEETVQSAILNVVFVIIIFSVGWTVSEFLMSLIMGDKGVSLLLPRYAFSLTFLTVIEFFFYRFYYLSKSRSERPVNN
jgi:hypothetical protein